MIDAQLFKDAFEKAQESNAALASLGLLGLLSGFGLVARKKKED